MQSMSDLRKQTTMKVFVNYHHHMHQVTETTKQSKTKKQDLRIIQTLKL